MMHSDQGDKIDSLQLLQQNLGYQFRQPELLQRALTHSSYANERAEEGIADNERLEFLGDAVLGFVISDFLFRSVKADEGKLTLAKSHLVSARNIRRLAERLQLGDYLMLGRGEEKDGGRTKASILSNAFEAIIGAIYLDGGIKAARAFVHRVFRDALLKLDTKQLLRKDYKSYLQELLQANDIPPPSYTVVGMKGPEHSKQFTIELLVGDFALAQGKGRSKKQAEQFAARAALERFEKGELELSSLISIDQEGE